MGERCPSLVMHLLLLVIYVPFYDPALSTLQMLNINPIANNPNKTLMINDGTPKMFDAICDNKVKGVVIILIISVAIEKIQIGRAHV